MTRKPHEEHAERRRRRSSACACREAVSGTSGASRLRRRRSVGPGSEPGPALWSVVYSTTLSCICSRLRTVVVVSWRRRRATSATVSDLRRPRQRLDPVQELRQLEVACRRRSWRAGSSDSPDASSSAGVPNARCGDLHAGAHGRVPEQQQQARLVDGGGICRSTSWMAALASGAAASACSRARQLRLQRALLPSAASSSAFAPRDLAHLGQHEEEDQERPRAPRLPTPAMIGPAATPQHRGPPPLPAVGEHVVGQVDAQREVEGAELLVLADGGDPRVHPALRPARVA